MNRLKSFTMLELIVAMLVGTLLVAFLWSGFFFIQKNYLKWADKNQQVMNLIDFEQQFRKDLRSSTAFFREKDKLVMVRSSNQLEYLFQQNMVLRTDGERTDTLYCRIEGYELNFLETETSDKEYITQIDLTIGENEGQMELIFEKNYDARFIYNLLLTVKN